MPTRQKAMREMVHAYSENAMNAQIDLDAGDARVNASALATPRRESESVRVEYGWQDESSSLTTNLILSVCGALCRDDKVRCRFFSTPV